MATVDFTNSENKSFTFKDVEIDQFFVDESGDLMLKVDTNQAVRIADCDGVVDSLMDCSYYNHYVVTKILDITHIKF